MKSLRETVRAEVSRKKEVYSRGNMFREKNIDGHSLAG